MKRIGCVLLVALAVPAIAVSATSYGSAGGSDSGLASVAVPALDLGGLFGGGSENEPDENEPNEKGLNGQPAPIQGRGHSGSSSSAPLQIVLPAVGVVLALVIAAIVFVVRWVRRYRAWKGRMTFRARARMRRMADDRDRAREAASPREDARRVSRYPPRQRGG